jgi:hypothetical protein
MAVGVGDVIVISAGSSQRVANVGKTDLVFYCVILQNFPRITTLTRNQKRAAEEPFLRYISIVEIAVYKLKVTLYHFEEKGEAPYYSFVTQIFMIDGFSLFSGHS